MKYYAIPRARLIQLYGEDSTLVNLSQSTETKFGINKMINVDESDKTQSMNSGSMWDNWE